MNIEDALPKAADSNSPQIIALCQQIVPEGKPIYLDLVTVPGAIVNNCFENVAQIVSHGRGETQYGWQLWEILPGIMAEAEFHAVWKDETGNFHDITPKQIPIN